MEEWGPGSWREHSRISFSGSAQDLLLWKHTLRAISVRIHWENCCQLKCQPILSQVTNFNEYNTLMSTHLTNFNGYTAVKAHKGTVQCKKASEWASTYFWLRAQQRKKWKWRGREGITFLTYHNPGVTNGVFGDGYPVCALLPPGWLAQCTSDSHCQLHRAASVPTICRYNIAANAHRLPNKDRGYLKTILYKPRDCN